MTLRNLDVNPTTCSVTGAFGRSGEANGCLSRVPGIEGKTGHTQGEGLGGRAATEYSSLVSFSCSAIRYQC